MTSQNFRHAILLAGWIAASAALAGPDIVKCTDSAGHVTLTDEPCREGSATVLLSGGAAAQVPDDGEHPLAVTRIVTGARVSAPRSAVRPDTVTRKTSPERMLARDVATLKEAYATMQQLDSSARPARLLGLN